MSFHSTAPWVVAGARRHGIHELTITLNLRVTGDVKCSLEATEQIIKIKLMYQEANYNLS